MKKSFKLEELDCANCAAKIENAANTVDGVNKVTVSFMAQKMIVDAEDARFDEVVKEIVKRVKKADPDCRIIL